MKRSDILDRPGRKLADGMKKAGVFEGMEKLYQATKGKKRINLDEEDEDDAKLSKMVKRGRK